MLFASRETSPHLIISGIEAERLNRPPSNDDFKISAMLLVQNNEGAFVSPVKTSNMPIERCLPTWLDGEHGRLKRGPFIFFFTESKRFNNVGTNNIHLATGVDVGSTVFGRAIRSMYYHGETRFPLSYCLR